MWTIVIFLYNFVELFPRTQIMEFAIYVMIFMSVLGALGFCVSP